ncbi:MAG: phosphate-starvation-inducible PsiE family protein [Actinomycetota bacterium]|nr:phosphate-starvation-inducible PsiE family protein [Actinomycetota bacterium]
MTGSKSDGTAPHAPAPPANPLRLKPLAVLGYSEDLLHYAVAALLLVLAGMVFYNTVHDLVHPGTAFATRIISGVDGVLFVIIVMELMSTVLAHFTHSGFQLKPFLIIGIISAVRHILTIGARLTLTGEAPVSAEAFQRSQIELGVETGVVLGLTIGLLLVRLGDRTGPGDVLDDD